MYTTAQQAVSNFNRRRPWLTTADGLTVSENDAVVGNQGSRETVLATDYGRQ